MIRTYREGEHKGGFIGVRVAVMIDGKAKQKYFSFKMLDKKEDEVLSDAKSLHAMWLMEKNLASSQREATSKELRRVSSPFSTGTKGIKFRISHNTCGFNVQGMTNQVRFNQHFSINKFGYDLAWFKACEYLQQHKNYSLFDKVYKNKPAQERLLITFSTYLINKAGFKISQAHTGAVTLIQRFGSALNLNLHFHVLFIDGVFSPCALHDVALDLDQSSGNR